jgi:hypothetical protein
MPPKVMENSTNPLDVLKKTINDFTAKLTVVTDKYLSRIKDSPQHQNMMTYARLVNKLLVELLGPDQYQQMVKLYTDQKNK